MYMKLYLHSHISMEWYLITYRNNFTFTLHRSIFKYGTSVNLPAVIFCLGLS